MPNVSLETFARYVTDAAQGFRFARADGLNDAGRRIAAQARGYIGEYQNGQVGPFGSWPPLAPSTVEEKTRLGYGPPDNPLLREGDMRASIGYSVRLNHVDVGATSPIAPYQEFGTRTIPPRSFIGRAMAASGRTEARRIGAQVFWPLLRRRMP